MRIDGRGQINDVAVVVLMLDCSVLCSFLLFFGGCVLDGVLWTFLFVFGFCVSDDCVNAFVAVGDLRLDVDVDCGTLLLCCLGVRCFGVVLSLIDDDVIAELMSVSITLIVLPSRPSG